MARYKHWLPLDQDINGDPEGWELTETFGDRAFRTWVEILSILERTENQWKLTGQWLESLSRKVRQKPATVQRTIGWMLASHWLEVGETLADGSPAFLRARNYAEYHRVSGAKKNNLVSPLPKHPNLPNHTDIIETTSLVLEHETTRPKVLRKPAGAGVPNTGDWPSIEAFVSLYNEQTPDECPAVQPPLSENRQKKTRLYLKQFPEQTYWQEVFQQIHASQFLRGLRPSNGHGSFRADFDWLLSKGKDGSENFVKVHDGRYHN